MRILKYRPTQWSRAPGYFTSDSDQRRGHDANTPGQHLRGQKMEFYCQKSEGRQAGKAMQVALAQPLES